MGNDVSELLHREAPAPSQPLDFDVLWRRGRQRRAKRTAVRLTASLSVVVLAVMIGAGLSRTPRQPDIAAEPPPGRADAPEGWQAVERFGLALSIPSDWDVLEVDACWSTPEHSALIVATRPLTDCGYEVPAEAPEFAVLQPLGDRRPVVSGWRLGPLVLSVSTSESSTGVWTRSALVTPVDESFRLTVFGTDRGFDDTRGVMMSLRIADAPMCIPDACQPPASEPGSVRFEVMRQQGRSASVSAANFTDDRFTGGAQWNLQRWNGDSWLRMDVAGDVWTLIGLILAPQDRTTGAPGRGVDIETELPPVAGWYRIAKTMSGDGVRVEILSPPIPVQAAAG